MTLTDFKERVYQGAAQGRGEPTAIVMNPLDWYDVQAEVVALGSKITPISFMGVPVATDPRRPRGAIALTWILEV